MTTLTNDLLLPNDLRELCRVCLQLPGEEECLDLCMIYDEDLNLSYSDCFTICTLIDLNKGENMPHNLCKSCGLELQVSYDFYKKLEESKQTLQQYKEALDKDDTKDSPQDSVKLKHTAAISVEKADVLGESSRLLNDLEDDGKDTAIIQEDNHTAVANVIEADFIALMQNDNRSEADSDLVSATGAEVDDNLLKQDNLDAADEECIVVEEHLDSDDCQSVDAIEEDETDTTLPEAKEDQCDEPLDFYEIDDNGKLIYLHHVGKGHTEAKANDDTWQLEAASSSDTPQSSDKWQENVVTVANREHLPVREGDDKESSGDNATSQAETPRRRKRQTGTSTCDYCHKVFPNYSRMMNHRRCHDVDRPKFNCELCGRIYATKQAMEGHIQTEHEKSGFACIVCHKVFGIRRSLEVHMRFHNGDFPYKCNLCDKKFAQLCHLNTHKNVRHNNVRFGCDFPNCGKFFTSSTSLRNHEFSHGAMPFECDICQRGYPAKAKLKIHIKRKHGLCMSKEELENMRKFHVMRSKVNLVKIVPLEEEL